MAKKPPKVEEPEEDELMDTYELEVTTADTLPLDDAIKEYGDKVEQPVAQTESLPREETMTTETRNDSPSDSDVLLDLGEYEPVRASAPDDDFVLDLDEEPSEAAEPAYAATPMRTFVEPQVKEAAAAVSAYESSYQPEIHSPFADTQELPVVSEVREVEVYEPQPEPVTAAPAPVVAAAPSISPDQLSAEMIDAIARRAVELMSDKVIREIAWEVVPDLAELLIKRQLEERQAK